MQFSRWNIINQSSLKSPNVSKALAHVCLRNGKILKFDAPALLLVSNLLLAHIIAPGCKSNAYELQQKIDVLSTEGVPRFSSRACFYHLPHTDLTKSSPQVLNMVRVFNLSCKKPSYTNDPCSHRPSASVRQAPPILLHSPSTTNFYRRWRRLCSHGWERLRSHSMRSPPWSPVSNGIQ